jgi:hypothetical protein
MPQRRAGIVEREQPRISASPKVATANAPKATSASVTRPVSKKANTPPRLGTQREQELFQEFQEFLEWRQRQKDPP